MGSLTHGDSSQAIIEQTGHSGMHVGEVLKYYSMLQ